MSEENVRVVRKLGDAWHAFMRNELSSDEYAELHDQQIELHWHDRRTYPDTPQDLRGIEDLIGFMEQYRSTWADLTQKQLAVLDAPDERVLVVLNKVAVAARVAFRSRSTSSR